MPENRIEPQFDSPPDWRQIARDLHDRLRLVEMNVMSAKTSEAMDAYDAAVALEDRDE